MTRGPEDEARNDRAAIDAPRLDRASALFLDALAEGGVEPLLEAGRTALGFPLHLLDPAFRLIASVGGEELRDPRWLEYSDEGIISESQLLKLKKSGFLSEIQGSRRPTIDPGKEGFPDIIGCDVSGRGLLLGRLGVWATGAYGETELSIVYALSKALSIELQRQGSPRTTRRQASDYFLTRLLSGAALGSGDISRMEKRLGFTIETPARVIVLQDGIRAEREAKSPQFIEDRLSVLFPQAHLSDFQDSIVLLLPRGKDRPGDEEAQLAALRSLAAKNELGVGLSRPFSELSKTGEAYRQALSALRLGSGEQRFFFYEDIFLLDLLSLCSKSVSLNDLAYPPILELRNYDARCKTDYLRTLAVFMDNSGNMARTAEILGLHYNTVKYRIGKIKDLLGFDLLEIQEQLKIKISLLILENAERLDMSS